jgi:CheY-like chemotaxis protein
LQPDARLNGTSAKAPHKGRSYIVKETENAAGHYRPTRSSDMATGADHARDDFSDAGDSTPAVLVAEDEVIVRIALSDCLADRGLRVYEAGNAAEAIRILEANDNIALVFSDVRMPGGMTGFDLANWIHANRPGLSVILTSGNAAKSELARELRGGEPFFEKPYDLRYVVSQICTLAHASTRRASH